jgi:hypothetical protein
MDNKNSRRTFLKHFSSLLAFSAGSTLLFKRSEGSRIGRLSLTEARANGTPGKKEAAKKSENLNLIDNLSEYRLPSTNELNDQKFSVTFNGGGSISIRLSDGVAYFSTSELPWPTSSKGPVDVVALRDGIYFIDIDIEEPAVDGLTLVLNEKTGWAIAVHQRREFPEDPNRDLWDRGPFVKRDYRIGAIDGKKQLGQSPALTRELIGGRDFVMMGLKNLYEHIYINSKKVFISQVITPIVPGKVEAEPGAYHKLDEGLYLVSFSEYDNKVAIISVNDYKSKMMTGKAHHPISFTESRSRPIGGKIIPVNGKLTYPDGLEPL